MKKKIIQYNELISTEHINDNSHIYINIDQENKIEISKRLDLIKLYFFEMTIKYSKVNKIERLPNPLNNYVEKGLSEISWRSLGLGASQFLIPIDDKSATARLIKIAAGTKVPSHSHQGPEMTLVLSGSFSDNTGHYTVGDLQEANEELTHQPHAGSLSNCICLAITDAPLRFNSLTARLTQPIIGI